jgi:hypothetical protein
MTDLFAHHFGARRGSAAKSVRPGSIPGRGVRLLAGLALAKAACALSRLACRILAPLVTKPSQQATGDWPAPALRLVPPCDYPASNVVRFHARTSTVGDPTRSPGKGGDFTPRGAA